MKLLTTLALAMALFATAACSIAPIGEYRPSKDLRCAAKLEALNVAKKKLGANPSDAELALYGIGESKYKAKCGPVPPE